MPDSLALALQARQNDLEKENALYGAGKQIMGLDSVNPMASVGSNLAAALIKGLGGAAMQNLGQYDVGQQLATDEQILNDIKYGRQPAQGTVWQERYEPYLNSYAQELGDQRRAEQAQQDALKNSFKLKGLEYDPNTNSVSPLKGYAEAEMWGGGVDDTNREAVKRALAKALSGQELTPEDAEAVAGNPRAGSMALRGLEVSGRQNRFEQGLDRKAQEKAIPGYTPAGDAIVTTKEAQTLREKQGGTLKLMNALDQLARSEDSEGFLKLFGDDAALQQALASKLFNAGRVLTNSGANFTETEQKLVKDTMPVAASSDPVTYLRRVFAGKNQAEFARTMMKLAQEDLDLELLGSGYIRKDKPLDSYNPTLLKRFTNLSFDIPNQQSQASSLGINAPQALPNETEDEFVNRMLRR